MKLALVALAAVLVVTLLVAEASGGSSRPRPAVGGAHAQSARARSGRAPSATRLAVSSSRSQPQLRSRPRREAPVRRVPAPGSLPQTHTFPSASSVLFKSLMGSLWAGVTSGRVGPALRAFFPRGAYVQLKAIPSAASDWSERLVHDYALDIAAAHRLLEGHGASARLLAVSVPSSYGHWVPPGVCYNSIGYYEVPSARVVYRVDGRTRSFGIASMISWRGVWYVVHLGAVLRASDVGVVDEPASGRGSSQYSGTC